MSIIAIVGGTGTVGALVAGRLTDTGHDVRVLSRSAPEFTIDLTTGEGLEAALEDVDVVVDAANAPPNKPEPALVDAQPGLLAAERNAGVEHHICLSIIGIDDVPTRYYKAKVAQEAAVRDGGVPFTIVRATQFHEFLGWGLGTFGRFRTHPRLRARLQPIAAADVAEVVASLTTSEPANGTVTVAGPEVHGFDELGRQWRRGRRLLPLPVPLKPSVGRPLRAGALTCAAPDHRGTTTFATWLQTQS